MKTKMKEKISFLKYDPVEYIETKEDVIAFLTVLLLVSFFTGNPSLT